jgi:hypothetical protein
MENDRNPGTADATSKWPDQKWIVFEMAGRRP